MPAFLKTRNLEKDELLALFLYFKGNDANILQFELTEGSVFALDVVAVVLVLLAVLNSKTDDVVFTGFASECRH